MKVLKSIFIIAVVGSSSLVGQIPAHYYFNANVLGSDSQGPIHGLDPNQGQHYNFTYDSNQQKIIGWNLVTNYSTYWRDVTDGNETDAKKYLADYSSGWEHTTAASGSNFVKFDDYVDDTSNINFNSGDTLSVVKKSVEFSKNFTDANVTLMTRYGAHAAIKIGNSSTSHIEAVIFEAHHDSYFMIEGNSKLLANTFTMDGSTIGSTLPTNLTDAEMTLDVAGTAVINTLKLGSTNFNYSDGNGGTVTSDTASMVIIRESGSLEVKDSSFTTNVDVDDRAVIMLEAGGILAIKPDDVSKVDSIADKIDDYKTAGGIFVGVDNILDATATANLNVHKFWDSVYVTTLAENQVPEPSHASLIMGLFALLYLSLSARKVAL